MLFQANMPKSFWAERWRQQHISSIGCQVMPSTDKFLMSSGTINHLHDEIYKPSNLSVALFILTSLNRVTNPHTKSILGPHMVVSSVIEIRRRCTGYGILSANASSFLTI